MSRRLKRKEDLREGLQRISEKRLQDMLQLMSQVGLTAERVHDARKVIKNLRAILRLTAGALPVEVRKTRNQALRDLADRLSGPRDAAVTLATFEKTYRESLKKNPHPTVEPRWARELQQSLAAQLPEDLPEHPKQRNFPFPDIHQKSLFSAFF